MPCLGQDAYHDDSSPWTLIADAVHADAVGDEDGLARGVFAHGVALEWTRCANRCPHEQKGEREEGRSRKRSRQMSHRHLRLP